MNTFIEELKTRSAEIDRQYSEPRPPEPIVEVPRKQIEERWLIYYFTIPIKYSKKIAWGFESKFEAQKFINNHLNNIKFREIKIDDKIYLRFYDVILESRKEVDILENDPIHTTVGNNIDDVLARWLD